MIQAKVLLHNEHMLLQALKGAKVEGVERSYGLFVDELTTTKVPIKRYTLVLDAYNDKSSENWMNISDVNHYISLQEYISRHKLTEREALRVFYEISIVVERIHSMDICHRDLKIQNFLINYQTRKVMLTNFCLGVHCSDTQVL